MRLMPLLTKRNIIGVLVVGAVVLGTGFGYIVPAFSDTGVTPGPDSAGQVGVNDGDGLPDEPDDSSTSSGNANSEDGEDPRQTASPSEPTSPPTTGEAQNRNDSSQDSEARTGDETTGADGSATPGLVVIGETNATAD